MYSDRKVIPLLQETGVAEANGGVRFLTGSSQNRCFCACAVKNRHKTRLLCCQIVSASEMTYCVEWGVKLYSLHCQIAKILAPLWAIAVTEHDSI